MTTSRLLKRHPHSPKLLTFAALALTALASLSSVPERYSEQFNFSFEPGKHTLAPPEISQFSAAFSQLKREEWCPFQVVVFGETAPEKAATATEQRMLASNRLAYLKGVIAAFEYANNQPAAELETMNLATAGRLTVLIVAGRCR
jgi:hypothetical protein